MSILNNSLLLGADAGAAGYEISRSLRFNSSDSAFCARTPSSAGNRKTFTFAAWVKRARVPNVYNETYFFSCIFSPNNSDSNYFRFGFAGDRLFCGLYGTGVSSAAVYRDYSAWYHVVLAVDTTQATASNRIRLYVNGSEITAFNSASYPAQNTDLAVNSTNAHHLGYTPDPTYGHDGYLADVHLIDGQQLTPSSFTEVSATTGQLIPKAYTGSFGTNGFWLKFSDNSAATATTLGKDYSGNGNNWTPNNLSVTAGAGNDSLVDTPTSYGTDAQNGGEVRGNYCTLNPIAASAHTYTNGNLDLTISTSSYNSVPPAVGTIAVKSGKWYFEFVKTSGAADAQMGIIATESYPFNGGVGNTATSYAFYLYDGKKINNSTQSSYGNAVATNDIVGVALDLDNGKIWFSKNGTWQASGDPAAGTNAAFTGISSSYTYAPAVSKDTTGTNTLSGTFNFGQRQWAYAAPSGFRPLVDTLLPLPVVAKSSDYFQTVLYTGNGGTQTISGLGFSPDFVWIKQRSGTVGHLLYDQIRGGSMYLQSNTTGAEGNQGANLGLYAFTSNGFSVGDQTNGAYGVNGNNISHVAWAFDAGTTTTTNTQGSITSQVRANASAGFSVVTGTGNGTAGHGLNVKPNLILVKSRTTAGNWGVYTSALGNTQFLRLNTTDAAGTSSTVFPAEPTSTVFSLGSGMVGSTENWVAYCFSPVAGYSNFGSYVGNGSSDGPFQWCGFRPRWVLIKYSSGVQDWILWDAARTPYNAVTSYLLPSKSDAEDSSSSWLDFTSNGFKIRQSNSAVNTSNGTYVWAAFAESPFQYARAR